MIACGRLEHAFGGRTLSNAAIRLGACREAMAKVEFAEFERDQGITNWIVRFLAAVLV